MKRQRILAVLAAAALIFTAFSCKTDAGSGDSGNSSQPGYVGKVYSAKDGKMYLRIDSKDEATLAVWVDGTEAQSSRAVGATGRYVSSTGKYTLTVEDGKDIFSLELEWTEDNGKSYSYEIVADITNGTALANFKINGNSVILEETAAAPEKPAAASSTGGGSSGGSAGGGTEPDKDFIPVSENLVEIPAASINGKEDWFPYTRLFVSGRKIEIPTFYMSDHPVTNAEYKDVIGKNPEWPSAANDKDGKKLTGDAAGNNPVNYVNWYDAIVYCNKLSIKKGFNPCYKINGSTNPDDWGDVPENNNNEVWDSVTCDFNANGYRLPTEAEWEWAARGGGEGFFYAGSDKIDDVAWYSGNTNKTGTRDVKSKKPNGYGLYDMSGNVYEWCWDWFVTNVSEDTPSPGPSSGSFRCMRGGAWSTANKTYIEVMYRECSDPVNLKYTMGFRVVRTIK